MMLAFQYPGAVKEPGAIIFSVLCHFFFFFAKLTRYTDNILKALLYCPIPSYDRSENRMAIYNIYIYAINGS